MTGTWGSTSARSGGKKDKQLILPSFLITQSYAQQGNVGLWSLASPYSKDTNHDIFYIFQTTTCNMACSHRWYHILKLISISLSITYQTGGLAFLKSGNILHDPFCYISLFFTYYSGLFASIRAAKPPKQVLLNAFRCIHLNAGRCYFCTDLMIYCPS